jgi:tetratricopeptide (TPR) repeat protein
MKTQTVLFVLLLVAQTLFANDEKYIAAMQKNIHAVYTTETIPDLQLAVNALERIAEAEKTKWEPYYYASFGYVMMSNRETEGAKKDAFLDQAMTAVNKAKEIAPNESEVVALEGFIYMMRVTIDPASRGPQYGPLSMQTFGKALALNPENPRALAMMAQMQYGTAQFFGSPTTEACATKDKALAKFETYKSENPLAPQWGKKMAEGMKDQCK